jgi:NADPH:quinone reductase-like Zn-dependent oxidoreductase
VLVQVHAAGVISHELEWTPTWRTATDQPRAAAIPGHELSGTVVSVGEQVTGLEEGDAVFGIIDAWFAEGAQAELAIAPAEGLAPKPSGMPHVEAAAVPISGLTAWQALFERAQLQPGQRVLIHGGAGAVGTFAVQLAHWRGAEVVATASAHNLQFLKELGADVAIDYHAQRFEDLAGQVDVVLDMVGGETRERSSRVLASHGTLLSVANDSQGTPYFFYVEANRSQLIELARLIDAGLLKSIVDSVLPLERAGEAYRRKPQRGKIVLEVPGATQRPTTPARKAASS